MGKVLGSSKITVRYQVTIPEQVRNRMNVKEGETLVYVEDGDRIYISTEF
jgi:AbrB family looped-hinge helix DNA binding protein